MFALVASMLMSLPAMPSASVTCADQPASCDANWVVVAAGDDEQRPRDYATPAEIECPTPAPTGPMLSGECDQAPPDLWYRVSRVPIGPAGTLTAEQRRAADDLASSFTAPPATPKRAATPDAQPLALVAVPALTAGDAGAELPIDTQAPPGRCLVPPDRPPRS
jgi:hypothetical protein